MLLYNSFTYFEQIHPTLRAGSTNSQLHSCCCWLSEPPTIHSCHTRSGNIVAAVEFLCIEDECSTETENGPFCGTLLLIDTGEGGGV